VPDILFEDGTYASVEDYIARMRDLDARARMILTDMRAKQARKRKPKAA
jgi:hypothetical protein